MRGARSARGMAVALVVLSVPAATSLAATPSAHPARRHHRHRRHHHRRLTVPPPAPTPAPAPAFPARTGVDEGEYYVRPTHPTVSAGSVEFDPVNLGMDEHDLSVRDAQGHVLGSVIVEPGQTQTLTLNLPAGAYTLFCSLYNHERLGMKATLTVR